MSAITAREKSICLYTIDDRTGIDEDWRTGVTINPAHDSCPKIRPNPTYG